MPLLRCGKLQVKVSDARSSHHCHHQSPSLSRTTVTYSTHIRSMHAHMPYAYSSPYLFGALFVWSARGYIQLTTGNKSPRPSITHARPTSGVPCAPPVSREPVLPHTRSYVCVYHKERCITKYVS